MVNVVFLYYNYECRYADWRYAEWCYPECRYAQCRGALQAIKAIG